MKKNYFYLLTLVICCNNSAILWAPFMGEGVQGEADSSNAQQELNQALEPLQEELDNINRAIKDENSIHSDAKNKLDTDHNKLMLSLYRSDDTATDKGIDTKHLQPFYDELAKNHQQKITDLVDTHNNKIRALTDTKGSLQAQIAAIKQADEDYAKSVAKYGEKLNKLAPKHVETPPLSTTATSNDTLLTSEQKLNKINQQITEKMILHQRALTEAAQSQNVPETTKETVSTLEKEIELLTNLQKALQNVIARAKLPTSNSIISKITATPSTPDEGLFTRMIRAIISGLRKIWLEAPANWLHNKYINPLEKAPREIQDDMNERIESANKLYELVLKINDLDQAIANKLPLDANITHEINAELASLLRQKEKLTSQLKSQAPTQPTPIAST